MNQLRGRLDQTKKAKKDIDKQQPNLREYIESTKSPSTESLREERLALVLLANRPTNVIRPKESP